MEEENFKCFHVSAHLYVCVCARLGVPDAVKTVGPLFRLGLAQQQLSSGRHTCLSTLAGYTETILGTLVT